MPADESKVTPETDELVEPSIATRVVEKRVTRTVIRRRAQKITPETEAKAQAEKEAEEAAQIEAAAEAEAKDEAVIEPLPVEKPKKEAKAKKEKKAAAEEEDEEKKDEYRPQYKRIKVVAAPPEPERPAVRVGPKPARKEGAEPPVGVGPTRTEMPITKPKLGRKEVIEIRDQHRPKAGRKKRLAPGKKGKKTEITVPKAAKRVIKISGSLTVSELAKKMSIKSNQLIGKLMGMGTMVTINQSLDQDTATLVASEFGYELERVAIAPEDLLQEIEKEAEETKPEDLKPRAPVVTVMGHVDHGKTSLLDAIRKTDVVSRESGGITQHIGAYSVKTDSGSMVTFVDTPGHEAFTEMRARGAKVTDIVVLVVAADDGVKPQTREAISHSKSAEVPIIVAINKIDKPDANVDGVKKALTEFHLVPEEWGGDTIIVPVSAKTKEGVPQLLEMLSLQSDILELKANPNKAAKGTVVESRLDKRRGPVTTVLVQEGTLEEGESIVVGGEFGRIRAMHDDKGGRIREAGPSTPVEILGLSGVAKAGDKMVSVKEEKKAKQLSELRQKIQKEKEMAASSKVSLDDLYSKIERGDLKELKIVVKADTAGSVEVLSNSLQKLSTGKVAVRVIHGAVGGISENDINLASASGALVLGFHVRPDVSAAKLAETQGVDIRLYDVIYELTEDVQSAMKGLLAPKQIETRVGTAEVRQTFSIPKIGMVAGCSVVDGKIQRNLPVRLVRDGVSIYVGKLGSLKRFKDDAREVTQGLECGMSIENFNDIKVGDLIEAFQVEEVAASLE